MDKVISLLASPEEALTIKVNVAPIALFDPIDAICERSISLCHLFNIYLLNTKVINQEVCNIVWQLEGNADLLDIFLKNYLANFYYKITRGLIVSVLDLCRKIISSYAKLDLEPKVPLPETSKMVIELKQLFISIRDSFK